MIQFVDATKRFTSDTDLTTPEINSKRVEETPLLNAYCSLY